MLFRSMPNGLTRHVSLSAGTWVLETLVRHYFARLTKDRDKDKVGMQEEEKSGKLRRDELLYDEVFHIVKVCGLFFCRVGVHLP